ncbi:MAG: diacylglycerol kinase family lipid kinase [Clostridia bacterium]|nr:diacylglycerol kinase family lipid kinase [Clostridia bacterium]
MDQKLLLIMNPQSGTKRANKYLPQIIDVFQTGGYYCEVRMTQKSGDARDFVKQSGSDAALIVCIGGDGTLNEVIDGLMMIGYDGPLGYIPAGSTNDFGSSLKLSKDPLQAARDIMWGEEKTLDICTFNDRYYAYVASCGAFTSVCYETPQQVKNSLGHLAYVLQGIKDLSQIRPIPMRVQTRDGDVFEDDYIFAAFSNSTSIAGILSMENEAVDMNDGLFELLLVKSPETMQELGNIVYSLLSQQYHAKYLTFCAADEVSIKIDESIDWTLDGEYAKGASDIVIRNIPDAIHVIVPSR